MDGSPSFRYLWTQKGDDVMCGSALSNQLFLAVIHFAESILKHWYAPAIYCVSPSANRGDLSLFLQFVVFHLFVQARTDFAESSLAVKGGSSEARTQQTAY